MILRHRRRGLRQPALAARQRRVRRLPRRLSRTARGSTSCAAPPTAASSSMLRPSIPTSTRRWSAPCRRPGARPRRGRLGAGPRLRRRRVPAAARRAGPGVDTRRVPSPTSSSRSSRPTRSTARSTFTVQAEVDVAGLWYRRSALDGLVVGVPRTWDEPWADSASTLAGAGLRSPIVLPGRLAGGRGDYVLPARPAGGERGGRARRRGRDELDGPGAVECLDYLRRLVDDGLVAGEVAAYDAELADRMLATVNTAFCFGGSYEAPALSVPRVSTPSTCGGCSGSPRSRVDHGRVRHARRHGDGPRRLRQAANPLLAVQLIGKAVAPEALAEMATTTTGQLPSRRSAISLVAGATPLLSTRRRCSSGRPCARSRRRLRESRRSCSRCSRPCSSMVSPRPRRPATAHMIGAITGLDVEHGGG